MDNIRAIRNDADLAWAIAEVEPYFIHPPVTGTPAADRFDVLSILIEAYEDKYHPIEAPDPVEFLKAHMDMVGRTQRDLAKVLGSSPRASEILNKRRALNTDMIYKLHKEWGIPAECLVRPYHLDREVNDAA